MNLLARLDALYDEWRRNRWLRDFAVFCRIALALGFIPSGIVKVTGERFTALPSNHPLGHYFDALYLTGSYYTFIGVSQLTAALLLLIPRTALLGAILYFPIILNICVLTYATRPSSTTSAPAIRGSSARTDAPAMRIPRPASAFADASTTSPTP